MIILQGATFTATFSSSKDGSNQYRTHIAIVLRSRLIFRAIPLDVKDGTGQIWHDAKGTCNIP